MNRFFISISLLTLAIQNCLAQCGPITDFDNNIYQTVTIGNQCWMKENLKTSHYNDGSSITEISDSLTWANIYNSNLQTAAWCYQGNDSSNNNIYGKLYNWYALTDSRGVCPSGWHVPSDSDWTILMNYLGGTTVAGGKLKSDTLWAAPNIGANDSSGFSAVPSGFRNYVGYFGLFGSSANFWSSTAAPPGLNADGWTLNDGNTQFGVGPGPNGNGLACRCVSNYPSGIITPINLPDQLQVYPNPTSADFSVKIIAENESDSKLEITDLLGRVLRTQVNQIHPGINEFKFNIIDKGVYFIREQTNKSEKIIRIVVQ